MRLLKSIFGVFGALVPVAYCGGLLYYFLDITGSVREADANGLGPTMVGLGVVGLLFSIPMIVKVVRLLIGVRSAISGKRVVDDGAAFEAKAEIDADAAVARYMAQRSVAPAAGASIVSPEMPGAPADRPGFGRRVR